MDSVNSLKNGKIGVMPTDTIYGIVGSALNPKTVEEIYRIRKRSLDKPMVILISSLDDLKKFGIKLTEAQIDFLQKHWPNPLSIVLPVHENKFKYLHRSTKSLAFRFPNDEKLVELIKQTGPLVAPSANFEGEKPSENINEAKKYFGSAVGFYVDAGEIKGEPSTLVELKGSSLKVLRQGKFKV